MWEYPYTDCMFPMHLVGELDLTWMQSQVFPQGVLAVITLMRGCMEMEQVELKLGETSSLLSGPS